MARDMTGHRKRLIRERGYKCENCDYPGYIELHHIQEIQYGGGNNDENLTLLCEKCHAEIHGYKKKTYLDEFRSMWEWGF